MRLLKTKLLIPDQTVMSLQDISLQEYKRLGKKGIIIDLDNTITLWKEDEIDEKAHGFIKEAKELGYKICLLTNSGRLRAEKIARLYDMDYLAPARKPYKKSFLRVLNKMELRGDQVLVIGDQLFTDVLGGNRAGCVTVLVSPLGHREFIGTKVLRFMEKLAGRE